MAKTCLAAHRGRFSTIWSTRLASRSRLPWPQTPSRGLYIYIFFFLFFVFFCFGFSLVGFGLYGFLKGKLKPVKLNPGPVNCHPWSTLNRSSPLLFRCFVSFCPTWSGGWRTNGAVPKQGPCMAVAENRFLPNPKCYFWWTSENMSSMSASST